nr:hypothetical protein [uncultured Devosia sp.]
MTPGLRDLRGALAQTANTTEETASDDVLRFTSTQLIVVPFGGIAYAWPADLVEEVLDEFQERDFRVRAGNDQGIRDHCDYPSLHERFATAYVTVFNAVCEKTGLGRLSLVFNSFDPRPEHNFSRDRISAHIGVEAAVRLFVISERGGHRALADIIRKRCTSRPGFASFYPSDVQLHLADPLGDWDHNQLNWLLQAAAEECGTSADEIEAEVAAAMMSTGLVHMIVAGAIDWKSNWATQAIDYVRS